jgi:hypothetical protein
VLPECGGRAGHVSGSLLIVAAARRIEKFLQGPQRRARYLLG